MKWKFLFLKKIQNIYKNMKTSGFKEYRLKADDKYYAKEIEFLEV